MIPVAGRPLVYWTMSYLLSLGITDFKVGVAERGLYIEEFVGCVFGDRCTVEWAVPAGDRGVGGTVAELVELTRADRALVVLGDTHFEVEDPDDLWDDGPVVLVSEVDETYRWCVADVAKNGAVQRLHEKGSGQPSPAHALIGVYSFPSVPDLRRTTRHLLDTSDGRIEMSEIITAVAGSDAIKAVHAERWIDCGNPDRQAEAQKTLLQERAFNRLEVDSVTGTITKRSTNVQKFIDEINYLRLLPPSLAVLYPRLVEFSTDWADPWATMEFYGYPTLSEVFVFEAVDVGIWRRVLQHISTIIDTEFRRTAHPIDADDVRRMYLHKLESRTKSLDGPPALVEFVHSDEVIINGRRMPGLSARWSAIESAVDELAAGADATIIHGDLCLSNILYDIRSSVCKLIDPRGSFGRAGITGDVRYDLAKLHHSIHGGYDFIVADLFDVSVEGNRLDYVIRDRAYHGGIRDAFDEVFARDLVDEAVPLISGLILLSLPALHYDAPERQLVMFARGLEIVNDVLERGAA